MVKDENNKIMLCSTMYCVDNSVCTVQHLYIQYYIIKSDKHNEMKSAIIMQSHAHHSVGPLQLIEHSKKHEISRVSEKCDILAYLKISISLKLFLVFEYFENF